MYFMMKKLILIFASLATFAGCEILGLDFMNSGSEDKENPDMEFRYCSRCDGNKEYCMDHLFTHEHVKKIVINIDKDKDKEE